jgi:hypothetical protein
LVPIFEFKGVHLCLTSGTNQCFLYADWKIRKCVRF